MKNDLFNWIDENGEKFEKASQDIWENPELGLSESTSSKTLINLLKNQDFDIEQGIGGMATSFVASYGENSPKVGILGEYDALPGLSQKIKSERDAIDKGGPGHGCGHNLLGTAGVCAAIAVKRAIEDGNLQGTVIFYGCPAEEILVGKTYMAQKGVFNDLDAAMTWHPSYLTTPRKRSSNALDSLLFKYKGIPTHAAGSPESGRSALDGVELLNTGVEYMREHVSDNVRIHYVITEGGRAPNIVPASASVWYFIRAPTRDKVEHKTVWLRDIAAGAAKMTQTEVEEHYLTGCHDYQANEVLTDAIWENMASIDGINYSDKEFKFAKEIKETISKNARNEELMNLPNQIHDEIEGNALYPKPIAAFDKEIPDFGSTDVGDVSWITPTGQFTAATWPVATPGHTWQAVVANGSFGKKGIIFAAKVLAGTVHDLMNDSKLLEKCQSEFENSFSKRSYQSPLPDEAMPPFNIAQFYGQ